MAEPRRFRKKPVVIEAVRVPTERLDTRGWNNVIRFLEGRCQWSGGNYTGYIEVGTLEGTMRADGGDWIIRGVKDEFYPCKSDIFEQTYEPVEP